MKRADNVVIVAEMIHHSDPEVLAKLDIKPGSEEGKIYRFFLPQIFLKRLQEGGYNN